MAVTPGTGGASAKIVMEMKRRRRRRRKNRRPARAPYDKPQGLPQMGLGGEMEK